MRFDSGINLFFHRRSGSLTLRFEMRDTVYRKKPERHAVQILRKTVQFLLNQPLRFGPRDDEVEMGEAV